jgi:hypothetical protein
LTSSFDEESIREFIQANQLPLVVEFNPQVKNKILLSTKIIDFI